MKIYRIYTIVDTYEESSYDEGMVRVNRDRTVKYVDSKEKVDNFFNSINDENNKNSKCYDCPILHLTKRRYDNGKNEEVKHYCDNKDLKFVGNMIYCKNEKQMNFGDYFYEEIDVE